MLDISSSSPIASYDVSSTKRTELYEKFKTKIATNDALDRTLVSFQANKRVPFYSWFKYREGFSEALVTYLLQQLMPQPGVLLDPFSGAGSALFAASSLGWRTKGIEVLPVGIYATRARMVAKSINMEQFQQAIADSLQVNFTDYYDEMYAFKHIAITRGAYLTTEEKQLIGYVTYCHRCIAQDDIRTLMLFAAFCVLEDMSYTRKDGQYLRWDERSGRSQGKKPFNKGRILTFCEAIQTKFDQMIADLSMKPVQQPLITASPSPVLVNPAPELYEGSSLTILPMLEPNSIDFVLTSPPYANRYDYTRTYALELVFLGCGEEKVKQLRQTMLSCTVENKNKRTQLEHYYRHLERQADFQKIEAIFRKQAALQEVLTILETYRKEGKLNNENISRLVWNYFYEMCFVMYELARILKPGGCIAMVNDNVRYAGEEVPVDLILSDMAESFGLVTDKIWTLARGKGNSSQQMSTHGRSELRKGVYIWRKPIS